MNTTQSAWLAGAAGLLEGWAKARQQKKAEEKEEQRFLQQLALKRLEDEEARAWKVANFQRQQEADVNRIAGMGAATYAQGPDGKWYMTEPKMNREDIEAAQQRVRGIGFPGSPVVPVTQNPDINVTGTPQAPIQGLGAAFGASEGEPDGGAGRIRLDLTPGASEAVVGRKNPRPGTGIKLQTGSGSSSGSADRQGLKIVNNAVADYEKIQTETDYTVKTLGDIISKVSGTRGGVLGAGAQKLSSWTGIGAKSRKFVQTEEVLNGLKGMAVQLLKPTFGGNISDGEREEVVKISGAADAMQPEQRVVAAKRMIEIANLAARRAYDKAMSLADNYGIDPKIKIRPKQVKQTADTPKTNATPKRKPTPEELRNKYDY